MAKIKSKRFVGIPYQVATSERFAKLKGPEVKLLIDLLLQSNGRNNGMLSACYTLMKQRGWAASSLYRAYSRLLHSGFIVVTRQGSKVRGKPTLVAVTWYGIDEPKKCEFDFGIKTTSVPLGYWYKIKESWEHKPLTKKN